MIALTFLWFQFSWFFFDLIVKSMAHHLVDSDKLKVNYPQHKKAIKNRHILKYQINLMITYCCVTASKAPTFPLVIPEPCGDTGGDGVWTHFLEV